jgi:hypothetical protein
MDSWHVSGPCRDLAFRPRQQFRDRQTSASSRYAISGSLAMANILQNLFFEDQYSYTARASSEVNRTHDLMPLIIKG